ncbi:hypothetical protein HYFRA_00012559 [Hymenoscyphus fraxineus]|uniref:Uncharacterized protein n=1 Tax=Hymenoscyphus fraxineus TaxID=746836 RepID=A0A9N9L936_9HELO|nr:hypothetical protein HYFRA_00012559 [Hymenoscyphus fraxineus]
MTKSQVEAVENLLRHEMVNLTVQNRQLQSLNQQHAGQESLIAGIQSTFSKVDTNQLGKIALENQKETLEKTFSVLEKEWERSRGTLEKQLQEAISGRDALRETQLELTKTISMKDTEIALSNQEAENEKKKYITLKLDMQLLNEKFESLVLKCSNLSAQNESLQASQGQNDVMTAFSENIAKYNSEISSLNSAIRTLEREKQEREIEITSYLKNIEKSTQQLNENNELLTRLKY